MKFYRVIGRLVNISAGILNLTKQQAAARIHTLTHIEDDFYKVNAPVQFKHNEEFGYDGDVNKALLQDLEEADDGKKDDRLQLIEKISTASSMAELTAMLPEKEQRKTVLTAAEKRATQLSLLEIASIDSIIDLEESFADDIESAPQEVIDAYEERKEELLQGDPDTE